MTETFLSLTQKEKTQILTSLATNPKINRDAIILEKDIWVCWILEHLFNMPNHLPMAFKGGTSLSKAFGLIERFSEDVDITIDYRSFKIEDPFKSDISNTKKKKISDELKEYVKVYILNEIVPYYEKIIKQQFTENIPTIEPDIDGETLFLHYKSVLEQKNDYITDSIRLEFGGRNLTTPNKPQTITADISKLIDKLTFPIAKVTVLSPQKTFWEKCTLMHYECNREKPRENADRISRHWYDVAMMINSDIGRQAIINPTLLKEVVNIKKTFYNSGFAKYDDCLNGNLRLIPNDDYMKLLKKDFDKMIKNKMFYKNEPKFDEIIACIGRLEKEINNLGVTT